MRFSPTSKFISIAKGAAKVMQWKVYCKKTANLDEALSTGTWIDCTTRVHSLPQIRSKVEYQLGQFTSPGGTIPSSTLPPARTSS
jgi:hypothetical protein